MYPATPAVYPANPADRPETPRTSGAQILGSAGRSCRCFQSAPHAQ
jgi:hypothetical protein